MVIRSLYVLLVIFISCSNPGQKKKALASVNQEVGGRCEGCEAIYECPVSFDQLNNTDTLPDFNREGPRLLITGTVFHSDGITPAKDVVVYAYHTNQKGLYESTESSQGWESRHGILRGWVKTDTDGKYKFYTLRPASYPDTETPQHVHLTIKEEGIGEYWIDSIHFLDDPFFTKEANDGRGGSGVVTPEHTEPFQIARRDIILGRNIPGYPQ